MLINVEQARKILNISRQAFWQRVYNSDKFNSPKYPKPIIRGGVYLFDAEMIKRIADENKRFSAENLLASTASIMLFKNKKTLKKYLYHDYIKEFKATKWLGEIYVNQEAFFKFYNTVAGGQPLVRFREVKQCIDLGDRKLQTFFEVTGFYKQCTPIVFSPDGKSYFNRKQVESFLSKQHLILKN